MAKRGFFKTTGSLFLPIGWLGGEVTDLKRSNRTIVNTIKGLFVKETPPENPETFDQAVARMELTEEDIKKTINTYSTYALIFILIALALFAYAFYLLFAYGSITGWLISLAATGFCLIQFFRYDFWAYQMKERRLGITFDEWKKHILGGKGTSR